VPRGATRPEPCLTQALEIGRNERCAEPFPALFRQVAELGQIPRIRVDRVRREGTLDAKVIQKCVDPSVKLHVRTLAPTESQRQEDVERTSLREVV
jgi:hypothetical protein